MRLAAKQLSIFLLCAVFLLCLYRAATQSFTIDESFTFLHYVNVSFSQAIAEYSANNHVLQSLLMRVFRRLLGRSELVMRLPTLIGCVLYLTAVYGITSASIRNGWLRLLALAVMTLNPLVLDLLVAARGYALALGLSWWALYLAWSDLLVTEASPVMARGRMRRVCRDGESYFCDSPRRTWAHAVAAVCPARTILAIDRFLRRSGHYHLLCPSVHSITEKLGSVLFRSGNAA